MASRRGMWWCLLAMLVLFHLITVVWLNLHGNLLSISQPDSIISRSAPNSPKITTIGAEDTKTTRKTMAELNNISNPTEEPLILFFPQSGVSFYGLKTGGGVESWIWENVSTCPFKCRFTFEWDKFKTEADLVVVNLFRFHWDEPMKRLLNPLEVMELQEATGQLWMGITWESPYSQYRGRSAMEIDGLFHWIGNYRQDADIQFSFGRTQKRRSKQVQLKSWDGSSGKEQHGMRRKKLMAWLVSHCETIGQREQLVRSLQKYIPIHIYGQCGDWECPDDDNCREFLAHNYKFYLAFENAICIDYVTEKLYASLRHEFVPVTYAWINDSGLLPPNSYINALDFKSVKDLADYLIHLDENEEEYRKYFKWKEHYEIVGSDGYCKACKRLLHQRQVPYKQYKRHQSIHRWMHFLPSTGTHRGNQNGSVQLRVGTEIIWTNKTCVHPVENMALSSWILGRKQS